MTIFTYTGAAFGNFKSVQIKPGPNAQNPNSVVSVGLGPYLITNIGWDANALANAWNLSPNAFFQQITASANNGGLVLTSNILGQDFEVTCTVDNGSGPTAAGVASTRMVLTVLASGGTFTLTDHNSLTTGAITYSSTLVTLLTRIQTAINALAGYSTGDVVVTNNLFVFTLDFSQGQFAGLNIPTWTANAASLTGGNALTVVTESQAGNTGQSQTDQLTFPIAGTHSTTQNEVQTLSTNATGGTFSLSLLGYGSTGSLPFSAGRSVIQAAMDLLIGAGNCLVTDGPLFWANDGSYHSITVTFQGALAATDMSQLSATVLTGGVNEQQQLLMTGNPSSGTFTLTFGGQTTAALPYTATAAAIQTALTGLSSIGTSNLIAAGGPLTVVTTHSGVNEVQRIAVLASPTTGTFTLSFGGQTTGALPYTATASAIQLALVALSSIGTGQIGCTGGPITTVTPVGGTDEVESLTMTGIPGTSSTSLNADTFTLTFGGQTTAAIPYNSVGSAVQTALQALSSIGAGNVSCSGGPLVSSVGPFGGADEIEQIAMTGPSSGTATSPGSFTLTFGGQTTGSIAASATDATIQSTITGLSSVGASNASVTGGPLCTVSGPTGRQDDIQYLFTPSILSVFTISWGGQTTGTLHANDTKATVQAALDGLSSIGAGNSLVTGNLGGNSSESMYNSGLNVEFKGTLANAAQALFTFTSIGSTVLPTASHSTVDSPAQLGSSGTYSYSYGTVAVEFTGTLGSTPQSLMTHSDTTITNTITQLQLGANGTYNNSVTPVSIHFTGTLGSAPQSLITTTNTAGPGTQVVTETTHGVVGTNSYSYTPVIATFMGTMAHSPEALITASAIVGITEVTLGVVDTFTYTYNPILATFQGTLANLLEPLITPTTVTGGTVVISEVRAGGLPAYPVTTVQNGGMISAQNISGGTFSLQINGIIVTSIPYNVTALGLAALVNAAFGATVVLSCSGGPAPNTPIILQFQGGLGLKPVTVNFINSLNTNQAGSVTRSVATHGSPDPIGTNVWDLTVCPGNGTLGVLGASQQYSQVVLVITNTLPNLLAGLSEKPLGEIYLPLLTISALEIESAINEALACDACRVVQIGRSQEWANVQVPAGGTGYGGTSGDPIQYTDFWYMKDIYRITFVNKFANSASLSITAHFPYISGTTQADPTVFMQAAVLAQDRSDVMDYYPEINRVVNGFVILAAGLVPIHIASIARASVNTKSMVGWRFKIQTQYFTQGSDTKRTGLADYPSSGTLQFMWSHVSLGSDGTPTYTDLLSSATLDWNSPASVIQSVLANMLFGVGNVSVTGGLNNSWLSESSVDDPVVFYSDLKVLLTGQLLTSPIDEFPYTLRCVLTNMQFASGDPSLQKNFRIVEDLFTRSLPPHFNRRERVGISPLTQPLLVKVGVGNQLVTIDQTSTSADVQAALDSLYPLTAALTAVQGSFPVFPPKLAHAVFVYGTNFADGPMDFEFTSLGLEGRDDVTVEVSSTPISQVVGQIVTVVQGISPQSEVQAFVVQGTPHAGTYTLGGSGAIAYNANAATIQTALGANPPVVAGTYPNFTLTWPSSSGTVALVATTSALNNSFATVAGPGSNVAGTQFGGLGASLAISDVTQGVGPLYYDCPANYTPTGVPGAGDTLILDDATSAISFGINQVCPISVVTTTPVSPAVGSVFQYQRNRQVFQNNQKVKLIGTGTAPAGLTLNTDYYIINQQQNYTFQLSASPGGSTLLVTTVGSGDFELAASGMTLQVYSRYSGSRIGLANLNTTTGLQEYLSKYLRISGLIAEIGIGNGSGVSMLRMDSVNEAGNFQIINSGQSSLANIPAILILCNNSGTVFDQEDGDTGFSFYSNESSLINSLTVHGGTLTLNNVTATLLESSSSVAVLMTNCAIAETRKLG